MKVHHCYFHHKENRGNCYNIAFDSDNKVGQGLLIEYNYFLHPDISDPYGDAGGEAVEIADSSQCHIYFRAILRYNLLEQGSGDGEPITNKPSGNLYYNNSW